MNKPIHLPYDYLKGIVLTDGHVNKNNGVRVTTSNKEYAELYRSFHWSAAMSPFANLNALELQGIDPTSFIEEHYEVDETKKAAYERWTR